MIGMPRITLIRPALKPDRTRMPDTRINAHSSPSTVDSNSEPMVTTTVSQTPCNRIGRNSAVSRRKFCIGSDHGLPASGGLGLETPFVENLVEGAVGLELGERGVDLGEQLPVGLADPDRDRADGDRLVGIDQPDFRKSALLQVIGQDRKIGETGLETARIHIAQNIGNGVVGLDLAEQSRLLQRVHEGRSDLRSDRLTLQIFLRGAVLGATLRHYETLTR